MGNSSNNAAGFKATKPGSDAAPRLRSKTPQLEHLAAAVAASHAALLGRTSELRPGVGRLGRRMMEAPMEALSGWEESPRLDRWPTGPPDEPVRGFCFLAQGYLAPARLRTRSVLHRNSGFPWRFGMGAAGA